MKRAIRLVENEMLDRLLQRQPHRVLAPPFGVGESDVQMHQRASVAAVVFGLRKVREYLKQRRFVVGIVHGGCSWVVDDAARVAAKASSPRLSGRGGA